MASLQLSLGSQSGEQATSSYSKTTKITRKLIATGCPYLEGMEESVVRDVVFSAGEARIRIIRWLLGRYHPQLQEVLFTTDTSTSTVPRLTGLLSEMGLCSREDYELIRGSTSLWKQQLFLEALLDLVGSVECNNLSDTDTHKSVQQKMEKSCLFVDTLCRCEDLTSVFPSSVELLPPDVFKRGDFGKAAEGKDKEKRTPVPSLTELRGEMEEVRARLEERHAHLEDLSEAHTYTDLDLPALESYHKTLTVSLGTLAQLITSFCACYEAELRPWSNRQPPRLSGLGQVCKRVHVHMQHVNKLLHCLQQLELTLSKLQELQNPPSKYKAAMFGELCRKGQEVFQDCLETISQTLTVNKS